MITFFKRKVEEKVDPARPGYEEGERKTPKAGYILLLAMFIASLFFGWQAIDDLKDVPIKPEKLSSCAAGYITYSWEDNWRYNHDYRNYSVYESYYPTPFDREKSKCIFSSWEKKYGIPEIFVKVDPLQIELNKLRQDLNEVNAGLSREESKYDLGLQEKQAGVPKTLFPVPFIQQDIESLRSQQQDLQNKISNLEVELKPFTEKLKILYKDVARDYRYAWRWYEFKVFLLEITFVFPFFLLVFGMYRKMLAKNSPYTIIFTALVGVASVLALRVFVVWFWSLFLARIVETIWKFIQDFALLKSLVFYGGMLFSIFLFGGAVYLLQKKIFDPRRVAIRRMRQKQCPSCQTSLDLAAEHCPNCGRKLKENCSQCGKERWTDFHFCQHCRTEKSQ